MLKLLLLLLSSHLAFSQCTPVIDLPFNGNANDVSGNANHGTASGTPTLTLDRFGTANSAYRFGGVGDVDYFTVSHNSTLVLSKYLTVSFWMRQCDFTGMDGWGATVARGHHCLWAKQGDGFSVQPGFWSFSSSNATGTMWNSFNNVNWSPSSVTNFSNSVSLDCFDTCEWVHIVHVIDSNKQRIYLNGALKQEFTITTADFSSANSRPLIIGKMDGTWYPYRGDMDEFKLYKCALNQTSINSLYAGYSDPKQANNIIKFDSLRLNKISCTNHTLNLYPNSLAGSFQYSKDSGTNWQTSNSFTNLNVGTYKIAVKSACTRKDTVISIQPCVFDLDVSGSFSTCLDTISISQNLTITDGDPSVLIDGAKIYFDAGYIKYEDSLTINTQFGITANFDTATGVLHLSGNATKTQYETVLKSIKYKNLITTKTISTKSIRFVLGKALYNANNGHYYSIVNHGSTINWSIARDSCMSSKFFGLQGYLVTLTDSLENDFVFKLIKDNSWIGASDATIEGLWRWVTGCEGLENGRLGRHFSNQIGSCGATTGTGTSANGNFQSWWTGEPNDASCIEEYAQFVILGNGKWNDLPNSAGISKYIIEYGCMPNDPTIDIQGGVTLNIQSCIDPCGIDSVYINQDATWESDSTVILTQNQTSKVGTATFKTSFNINNPIDKTIYLNFGSLDGNGADGISVLLQNQSNNYTGTASFNVGTNSNTGQLKIEFDTWQNSGSSGDPFGDPSYDHIAVLLDGEKDHNVSAKSIASPIQASASSANIEDGNYHKIRLKWNPSVDTIQVYFDDILRISTKYNLKTYFSSNPNVYFSIAGSTGGLGNVQKFKFDKPKNLTTTMTQSICQGDSFLGKNITGIYKDTFTSSNGCDSIRTLNLTVNPPTTSTISQTICKGDSFLGRKVSGTYTDTLKNANSKGCDSIRMLTLTVNPRTTSTTIQAICTGQSFWGYSVTGVYNDTLRNANSKGCDSIRILNLTASPNILKILTITQCQSYFFKGQNRTLSGTYRDTTTLASGCDSITELRLTIPIAVSQSIDTASCDSFKYKSKTYKVNSNILDTIKSSINCDSIFKTIRLTIHKPITLPKDSLTACREITYQNQTYFRDTILNMRIPKTVFPYCDSLLKSAKLRVFPAPNATLTATPDTIVKLGESINLEAKGGIKYQWNVSSSTLSKISIHINARTYVEVKVTDNNQCDSTVGFWLDNLPELNITEVFSPNGDGKNDFFTPSIQGNVIIHSWRIFNRWGQKIFESNNLAQGWDGKFTNQDQPQGSYVYQIEYTLNHNKTIKTGALTLIR